MSVISGIRLRCADQPTTGEHPAVAVARPGAHRPGRSRLQVAITAVIGALFVIAIAVGATWQLSGGRWASIETGSMGTAAPVGTLVWLRPAKVADLHRGDIITFQPPISGVMPHTHRIISIHHGAIRTKGDVNGAPDPWVIHQSNLIGVVVARWWGIAYLIRALPLLLTGLLALWYAHRKLPPRWATPALTFGIPLLISAVNLLQHPLLGLQIITSSAGPHRSTAVQVTSTGILPTQVSAAGGTHAILTAGQVATVYGPASSTHPVHLALAPHLSPAWALIVIAVCAAPTLWAIAHSTRTTRDHAQAPA